MTSKLRRAIAAVKDQTSISLAKVSSTNGSNLGVAILKATTHEEVPIDERYVNAVLLLTSSSPRYASACVHALARRITRTKNWVVALKSLTLVFKILQQGDPHFAQEALRAMKRGATLLNLSNFHDDSNSNPWDYTAFVRTFALYLEERLGCCLMGKWHGGGHRHQSRCSLERICDMKPEVLLDKITYWQRLLDRVIATRPTGSARSNMLVQISLYSVVQESFELYHDIFDGLAFLMENLFQLKRHSCIVASHICIQASKQFDELAEFYTLCKGLGIGRQSDYPSVKKISGKVLEKLEKLLKEEADSYDCGKQTSERELSLLITGPPVNKRTSPDRSEEQSKIEISGLNQIMKPKGDWLFEPCSPEKDCVDRNETSATKPSLGDQDCNMDLLDLKDPTKTHVSSSMVSEDNIMTLESILFNDQHQHQPRRTLSFSARDPKDQDNSSFDIVLFEDRSKQQVAEETNSCMDLVLFSDNPQQQQQQQEKQHMTTPYPATDMNEACFGLDLVLFDDGQNWTQQQQYQQPQPISSWVEEGFWEMVLVETATDVSQVNHSREGWDSVQFNNLYDYNNPFLQCGNDTDGFVFPSMGSIPAPTFNAKNPDQASILPPEADPFSSLYRITSLTSTPTYDSSSRSPSELHRQHQWVET